MLWKRRLKIHISNLLIILSLTCCMVLSNCDRSSENRFDEWQLLDTPDTTSLALLYYNNHLFLGTAGGIFRSSDQGKSWTSSSAGMTDLYVESLAADCTGNLFASTSGILYKSSNNGDSWAAVFSNVNTGWSHIAVNPDDKIFVSYQRADSALVRSTDGGLTWTTLIRMSDGLRRILFENDSVIYVANSQGNGYKSTDHGQVWTRIPIFSSESIAMYDAILYTTWWQGGLKESSDNGLTWTVTACPIDSEGYLVRAMSDHLIVTDVNGRMVRLSKGSWEEFGTGLPDGMVWDIIETPGRHLFAATWRGLYSRRVD